MKQPFRLDGSRQLLDTLKQLPTTTERSILRGTLKDALKPLAKEVKANAPTLWGDLEDDLHIGTRLNRRQASLNRADKATVEVHFGTNDPAGMMNEFGNANMAAQPFFRRAWSFHQLPILNFIKSDLGTRIVKGAERIAKRRAR